MLLVRWISKCLVQNIKSQPFPNHVIQLNKHDLQNIEVIEFDINLNHLNLTNKIIDLSKLRRLSKLKILDLDS